MSIATVVTRGFGTFGSVNLLPTLGYSAAAEAVASGPLCFTTATYAPGPNETYFHQPGPSHARTFAPGPIQTKPGCDCG